MNDLFLEEIVIVDNQNLLVYLSYQFDDSNILIVDKKIKDKLKNIKKIFFDFSKIVKISTKAINLINDYGLNYEVELINVKDVIYQKLLSFDLNVQVNKIFEEVNVDQKEVIGVGSNCMVYRMDKETIIKVYGYPDCLTDINRERYLAQMALLLGIKTAIPYDIVISVKNGIKNFSSIFELIDATSFSTLINNDLEHFDDYVELYINYLKSLHRIRVDEGINDIKKNVFRWYGVCKKYFDEDISNKLYKLLDEVNDDKTLVHGDYHTQNVLMKNHDIFLIDLDTLAVGNRVFEFGQMYLSYVVFKEFDEHINEKFLGLTNDLSYRLWRKSISLYFNTVNEDTLNDIENKSKVIAYLRLMRRAIIREGLNTDLGQRHFERSRKMLIDLVTKLDNLAI